MVIHSKTIIIDDNLVRAGSSTLSNRSMGLDTECDLAIEAGGRREIRDKIAAVRHKLMAEHLGAAPEIVAETLERTGAPVRTVEDLRASQRTLKPLEISSPEWITSMTSHLIDAERPVKPDDLVEELVPEDLRRPARHELWKLHAVIGFIAVLGALWKWGPLAELVDLDALVSWGMSFEDSPMAMVAIPCLYVAAGLTMMPLTPMVVATALIFDPPLSIAYAYAGSITSALALYGVGHVIGRHTLRRLAGSKLKRISKFLASSGLLAVATVRLVPIAPYSVVNLVMGASRVPLQQFILGTVIGLTPGIVMISLFTDGVRGVVTDPGPENVAVVVAVLLAAILGGYCIRRSLGRHVPEQPHDA
jgi:uncharacterized membrane protein YdjX (TVP38/TMEM64 family)